MIIGIGTDLVDIRRIERILGLFGKRFIARVFTATERVKAETRPHPAASYAQSYAAKEACAKALGTGFREGVFWRDMGVDNLASGKPVLTLSGGARKRLEDLTPPGMKACVDLTQSDEAMLAQAVVVISANPESMTTIFEYKQ